MKRRALVALALLAPLALRSTARAQDATTTQAQIDLALAYVSLTAMRTRYGEAHAEVVAARARVESLAASLRSAIARGGTIDTVAVSRALDVELADVRARLGEFSSRCGAGHPDMESARAREAALTDALAHVTSDGSFFPP